MTSQLLFTFFAPVFQYDEMRLQENTGAGANCSKIIIILTDGGIERPEGIIYNHDKDKKVCFVTLLDCFELISPVVTGSELLFLLLYMVHSSSKMLLHSCISVITLQYRIFTFAMGLTPTPLDAVKWLACENRGEILLVSLHVRKVSNLSQHRLLQFERH